MWDKPKFMNGGRVGPDSPVLLACVWAFCQDSAPGRFVGTEFTKVLLKAALEVLLQIEEFCYNYVRATHNTVFFFFFK